MDTELWWEQGLLLKYLNESYEGNILQPVEFIGGEVITDGVQTELTINARPLESDTGMIFNEAFFEICCSIWRASAEGWLAGYQNPVREK